MRKNIGETKRLCRQWQKKISKGFERKKYLSPHEMKIVFENIAKSFADIEQEPITTKKVCVAGELLYKVLFFGK